MDSDYSQHELFVNLKFHLLKRRNCTYNKTFKDLHEPKRNWFHYREFMGALYVLWNNHHLPALKVEITTKERTRIWRKYLTQSKLETRVMICCAHRCHQWKSFAIPLNKAIMFWMEKERTVQSSIERIVFLDRIEQCKTRHGMNYLSSLRKKCDYKDLSLDHIQSNR